MRFAQLPVIALGWLAAGFAFAPHARAVHEVVSPKGEDTAIVRHVVAGGGGASSGAGYTIRGTAGQLDAEPLHPATSGGFAVTGGFWTGGVADPQGDALFRDGFE